MYEIQEQNTQEVGSLVSELEMVKKRSSYVQGLGYESQLKRSSAIEFPNEETKKLRQQIIELQGFKTKTTTQLEELKAMIQSFMPQQSNLVWYVHAGYIVVLYELDSS